MKPLLDISPQTFQAELMAAGAPAFRSRQIIEWIWKKHAGDFNDMTNLPKAMREELVKCYAIFTGRIVDRVDASDGCIKLLLEFPDGGQAETVMIPEAKRATACISTQVGCAMKCDFCASGADGFVRNLTTGEILEQVLQLQRMANQDITNVVLMGMGEPLANLNAVIPALFALHHKEQGNISARRITVSTVGLPKEIDRLADIELPITLAISLHAPNDELRQKLIPVAAQTPLRDILGAARRFFASHGREVTFEYTLLAGVNDSPDCARQLAQLLKSLRGNSNLIRYNPHPGSSYCRPENDAVHAFAEQLRDAGLNVTVRRSRGQDAQAACGQLRQRHNHTVGGEI